MMDEMDLVLAYKHTTERMPQHIQLQWVQEHADQKKNTNRLKDHPWRKKTFCVWQRSLRLNSTKLPPSPLPPLYQ